MSASSEGQASAFHWLFKAVLDGKRLKTSALKNRCAYDLENQNNKVRRDWEKPSGS